VTTTTLDAATIGSQRSRPPLLAPLAGLAFVGGLIALFVTPAGDESGETPREVVAYAASHEGWIVAMALFALATIPLGGIFVAALLTRLRGLATATESTLVLIGGIVFTLCFGIAFTVWSAPLTDVSTDTSRALAEAETYLAVDDIGWFLLGAAGVGAAMMAIPASLAASRSTAVPTWLCWVGVALGVASLGTIAFLGMFAWMAWIAGASIVMLACRR
jgi:hypothetical protein